MNSWLTSRTTHLQFSLLAAPVTSETNARRLLLRKIVDRNSRQQIQIRALAALVRLRPTPELIEELWARIAASEENAICAASKQRPEIAIPLLRRVIDSELPELARVLAAISLTHLGAVGDGVPVLESHLDECETAPLKDEFEAGVLAPLASIRHAWALRRLRSLTQRRHLTGGEKQMLCFALRKEVLGSDDFDKSPSIEQVLEFVDRELS